MATTTPNYGWTVPTSTDLVKDGATAIETLGDAIDASMNTALGTKKAGMVLLNTTSFSGVSSQSINDVFSATYANYKVIVNISGSDYNAGTIRLRVAGADSSSSDYDRMGQYLISANSIWQALTSAENTTAFIGPSYGNNGLCHNVFEIHNPFTANRTTISGVCQQPGGSHVTYYVNGQYDETTSFTGFTIIAAGVTTITGSIQVYGYNL
jgi:hypothetical protein